MQTRDLTLAFSALFSALLLAGCGGGGSGSRVADAPSLADASINVVPSEHRGAVKAAKTFKVEDILETGVTVNALRIDGQTVSGSGYDLSSLESGLLAEKPWEINYTLQDNGASLPGAAKGNLRIYNQPYSLVMGWTASEDSAGWIAESDELNHARVFAGADILGLPTTEASVNTLSNVSATYTGRAFTPTDEGNLNYTVNFGKRTGEGSITGIAQTGRIDLLKADIGLVASAATVGIAGNAQLANGPSQGAFHYALGFFGPGAEEIVGEIYGNGLVPDDQNVEVLFGGARGDLTSNVTP